MLEKYLEIEPIIYTSPDLEYIRNNTTWIVRLSDGSYVYQRDDEENYPGNSWLRLKRYIQESGLKITELAVKFRDHQENAPAGKDGYFFIRSLLANCGTGEVQYFFKLGYLENNQVHIVKYSVPELIQFESETFRDDDELLQECLIRNV